MSLEFPDAVMKTYKVDIAPMPDFTPTPIPTPSNFVFIPAGNFLMGSPQDEMCHMWMEYPEHSVSLTQGFYMQQTEVTQSEYMMFFDSNPSRFTGSDLPVDQVTWQAAIVYCNRLSVASGLTPCYYLDEAFTTIYETLYGTYVRPYWDRSADGFRLPTEAEWEYACRAGTTTPYNNGQTNTGCGEDANLNPLAWYYYNSNNQTHPVGMKQPNNWNLYDMHGNLKEWCWDYFDFQYYSESPPVDPLGPEFVENEYRSLRGGGWNCGAGDCRSADRDYRTPNVRNPSIGFRIVRSSF